MFCFFASVPAVEGMQAITGPTNGAGDEREVTAPV